MEKILEWVLKGGAAAVLLVAVIALGSLLAAYPVKWCWNETMPYLFHLPEIGFVKAFCLCWLAGALVKSSLTTSSK